MELTKEELRQRFLSRLKMEEGLREEASARVVKHLSLLLARAKGPIACFRGLNSEPDLLELIDGFNLDWVFPKVEGENLSFYRATWNELKPGAHKTYEPPVEESRKVNVSEIAWALIPGVSFDRQGIRLGRGKGFYDRSLEGFSGVRVGVSFYQGLSNVNLPREDHDLKVDWLVTDRFVMRVLGD